ncbi:MAG: S-layer protein, partial [Leptolyngbya sp. SIO1D8]|nr:S-layer protein [Leptolyngbya sp. SIO1D8]
KRTRKRSSPVRLQAGDDDNGILSAGGGLANSAGGDFDVVVNDFYYSFPLGSRVDAILAANSIVTDDFVTSTIVPFDGPSVADPGGPVFYDFDMGGGGFAGGLNFALTDNIVIDAGYSADNGGSGSNDPDDGGIFGADSQSYIIQGNYLSDGLINAGIAYLHGNDGDDDDFTDTFAGLLSLDFGRFIVAGSFAFHDNGDDDDTSWMAGIALPDLFLEGSQLGVYYADLADYDDDPYMIEGYYEVPVNQFLTITPAVIYGDLDTGGDDDSFYGAIRATFSF